MKNSIKRIISFALMLSLLVGMMMTGVSVSAAEETPEVEIVSKNVYYAETLKLMYAVRTDDANVKLNIYTADGELAETITNYTDGTAKGEASKFFTSTIGVPAQNIDTVFYAEAELSDGTKSAKIRYSVLEYLYERLTVSEDVTDAQKTMYNNLLAYADSADIVLNGDTESNIAKYAYVRVENGTVDGTYSAAMVLAGTVIDGLTPGKDFALDDGAELAWEISSNDLVNPSSKITKNDADIKAGDFAVKSGMAYAVTPVSLSSGVELITASKTIAELIVSEGWTNTTTKQSFKLDDVVSVKINGGSNTGKAYDGNHIRIYATDSPAGTMTISLADGYELVTIKITTQTGTYAYLYVDGTTTDISNVETAVSGSSVLLNSVKNGTNGKQVRVTAIEVVYQAVQG